MELITSTIGRLHPLVVHLPIGMLIMAFILECSALFRPYRKFRKGVVPALFFGGLFAVVATLSGFFLRQEGGYDEELADRHQYLGLTTTVMVVIVFFLRRRIKSFYPHPLRRRRARVWLLLPLMILLGATGHMGGSLTHGEAYLFESPALLSSRPDETVKLEHVREPLEARFYQDVIHPILKAKCYSCHSAQKQKGKLRLDEIPLILKGGKNGAVISPGVPDSSELYHRVTLPIEEKKHMPPREKPQLSSSETDLLHAWIAGGADFSKKVASHPQAAKVGQLIRSLQYTAKASWVPDKVIEPADPKIVEKLAGFGVTVMKAAEDSHYLLANFTNVDDLTVEKMRALEDIRDQLIWLNVSGRQLTTAHTSVISKLINLRMLYVDDTSLDDEGAKHLISLHELRYLNLVGTNLSDKGLMYLAQLKNLGQLFVYDTKVTKEGVRAFLHQRKEVVIDTGGYVLPKLPGDTVVFKRKI